MTTLFRPAPRWRRSSPASRSQRRRRPSSILFTATTAATAPPADIPGGAWNHPGGAELVLRVNQLEAELRQANGRIEELENAEHRLEDRAAEVPPGRRIPVRRPFRQAPPPASTLAPAAPSSATPSETEPPPPRPRKSDAFDPDADPNAPGAPRPLGTTPASAPLVREARGRLPVRRSNSAKDPRPPSPPPSGPTIVGSGVAMLDQPREQFNAALQAFQAGQYPGGRSRLQVVSRRQSVASAEPGRDLLYRRDLSSALAAARGGRAISQSHHRLFQVVAGAGEHGPAWANSRRPRQY